MKSAKIISAVLAGLMLLSTATAVSAVEEETVDQNVEETVEETTPVVLTAPKISSVKNTIKGITVKWKKSNGAEKYVVYAKKAKGSFKKLKTVSADTTSYTHTSAVSGTKYTYRITAKNSASSVKSAEKTLLCIGTPKLTASNTSNAIKVTWKKVKGATKYVLQYKKPSAKKYLTAYKGTKTSYKDSNIGPATKYQFRIKAQIKKESGAYSDAVSQLFLEKPTIDANESPFNMKGISVIWKTVKGAKGYYVYRKTKYGSDAYKKIATIADANKKSYFDTDVESVESYKYYIRAYSGSYKSAKSNVDWEVYGSFDFDNPKPLYLTIKKGQTYRDISQKLDSYGALPMMYFWSENTKIATVDSQAIIKGIKKGTVNLYARGTYNSKNYTAKLVVTVK